MLKSPTTAAPKRRVSGERFGKAAPFDGPGEAIGSPETTPLLSQRFARQRACVRTARRWLICTSGERNQPVMGDAAINGGGGHRCRSRWPLEARRVNGLRLLKIANTGRLRVNPELSGDPRNES